MRARGRRGDPDPHRRLEGPRDLRAVRRRRRRRGLEAFASSPASSARDCTRTAATRICCCTPTACPRDFTWRARATAGVQMKGNEVYKVAVNTLGQLVTETLNAPTTSPKAQLDWLIPHQANLRIIEAIARRLDLPMERVIVTIGDQGNTSAASVPLALDTGHPGRPRAPRSAALAGGVRRRASPGDRRSSVITRTRRMTRSRLHRRAGRGSPPQTQAAPKNAAGDPAAFQAHRSSSTLELLRNGLLEHAIDLLVDLLNRLRVLLSRRQRLVGRALRAGCGGRGTLRCAHRSLRIALGLRGVALQLRNLRLEIIDLGLDRLQVRASCKSN